MRKLVSGLFISADGVAESPDQWQFEFDEEMGAAMAEQISRGDAILLGRVTYQEWAGYWPVYEGNGGDAGFADFINQTPKYVVSTTLDEAPWGKYEPATLISENVEEEIARLKERPGGDILICGSPLLAESMLHAGLLDELVLLVHPVVAGRGKRLFRDGRPLQRLRLVGNSTTSSGVAMLTYVPAS